MPDDPVDLDAAVQAAQRGDQHGFAVLFRDLQPRLLRYLRVVVGRDAEDVAADAWLQIARDVRSFRGGGDDFRDWATRIARNRAVDHLRRVRRRPIADVPVDELPDWAGSADTEEAAVASISTDTALALIACLPPDQAEAVVLRVVVGLDAKAAGHVLGKRPGAVRSAAYRGLRALAGYLESRGVTEFAGLALKEVR